MSMMRDLRWKFELAAASLCAVLAIVTSLWPDWIERLFDASPDGGDGGVEWGIVVLFALAAMALVVLAGWEWRRLRST